MSRTEQAATERGPRVLVVDDAVTVRAYTRQVLEADGFVVDEAVNGIAGLEQALADPPDLLIVDVNMPKMDGYSMLRTVRREAALATIPALMITTESKEEDRLRALAAGASGYLTKPVRPEALVLAARLLSGRPVAQGGGGGS
ncbi:response regulator [Azospirillum sp. ST 5-10]|uniref:response regulator n=1 Tax=unclassified Azospirillum TaxID=2630922 RepID=UPI003F4A0ACD